ncbi:hypothetical protein SARC_17195, partial [Sphaeroforma arctica JP610]
SAESGDIPGQSPARLNTHSHPHTSGAIPYRPHQQRRSSGPLHTHPYTYPSACGSDRWRGGVCVEFAGGVVVRRRESARVLRARGGGVATGAEAALVRSQRGDGVGQYADAYTYTGHTSRHTPRQCRECGGRCSG